MTLEAWALFCVTETLLCLNPGPSVLVVVSLAITRGTVLEGVSPLTGASIAGEPQDNISPWKLLTGVRVGDRRERLWGAYSVRAQGDVTRVSPLLSESPFLIAQDLLALEGFTVHRLAVGYDWRANGQRHSAMPNPSARPVVCVSGVPIDGPNAPSLLT